MTFLNSLLLGGIAAASIPLIIHLLNRRRFRRVAWGAMHFLESVLKQNRRRVRIEQLLLLLLRAAIPAVLAFCMARPVITGVRHLVRDAKTSLLVLLDNSFSMEVGDEARSNFTVARENAGRVMTDLPRGSEVAVLGMAGDIPGLADPSFNVGKVRKEIDLHTGGYGQADVPAALEKAAGLFASRMHHADRELLVISDFQRVSWSDEQGSARQRAKALLLAQPVPPRVVLMPAGRESRDNVAVEEVALSREVIGVNQPVTVRADLKNYGVAPCQDLRVYFRVDGEERSVSQVTLGAGQGGQVVFAHKFDTPGSHLVEIHADADRLQADNTRLLSVPVLDRLPVLLVSGDTNPEPLRGETDFLNIALQPYRMLDGTPKDLMVTRVIGESSFAAGELSDVRVVILANVRQLTHEQQAALETFVREGGGLLLFPGDRVNATWYNSALFAGGQGLLPAALGELEGSLREDDDRDAGIIAEHYAHPALAPFNSPNSGNLMSARIRLRYRLDPATDLAPDAPAPTIMARLDTGSPYLVEKAFGEGRVIVCCTACDADWNNLPMRPFYLPLQQQLVTYLASKVYPPRNVVVGERLGALTPLAMVGQKAVLQDTQGEKQDLEIQDGQIRGLVEFEDTGRPGLYLLTLPDASLIHFVVNTSREESNTALLDVEGIRAQAAELGATLVRSWDEYREMNRNRRFGREIWKPLLTAVLVLLFGELLLVQFFTRRTL
jgi:hypothetical protein